MIWRELIRAASASVLLVSCAYADTLRLDNGDELTGTFQGEENGSIVFLSPVLGELRVPSGEAVVTLDPKPEAVPEESPPAEVPEPSPVAVAATEDIAEEEVEEVEAEQPAEEAAPEPTQPTAQRLTERWHKPLFNRWYSFWEDNAVFGFLGKYYPLMDWKNKFELGLDFDFAQSDSESALVRMSTERDAELYNIKLEASYELAETTNQEGITTQTRNRIRTGLRLQRDFFGDRFFAQSDTRYNRDVISRIHEIQETVGMGYRLVDTERWEASLVPNFGATYQQIADEPERFGYVASLQQVMDYQFTERISVSEEANISYVPKGDEDYAYVFGFKGNVENRLNSRMYLNLRYEYRFDQRVDDPSARTSQSVTLSLGAEF